MPLRDTADDGTFRVVAIPGPVLLMAGPDGRRLGGSWDVRHRHKHVVCDPQDPQYFPKQPIEGAYLAYGGVYGALQGNWCKVLDIKPGVKEVRQDAVLEPASVLLLSLRDPSGKTLTGAWAGGTAPRDWYPPVRCATDTCAVYDAEGAKHRLVVLFHPESRLAARLELNEGEKPPSVVTLRPTGRVKGRLVRADGQPVAGAGVTLGYKARAAANIYGVQNDTRQIITGADGSFVADAVLPGLAIDVTFSTRGKQVKLAEKGAARVSVESGETKDLGSLAVREDRPGADE
jgi:hypothetical protein